MGLVCWTQYPKFILRATKLFNARASGLHFTTPSWAWMWYQKVPIMFNVHGASVLPKIHVYSCKTLDALAWGQHFPTPPWAWSWPWGWYKKEPIMFFHRASMLTYIPKIYVYSLKTLDARASGLHFPTPSWAWSLHWRWYQKVPIMFLHRAIALTNIPEIHVYSFKTLDARASGLYSTTPYWAWSWTWGWYQKLPIMFFQSASMLNKIPKIRD